MTTKEIDYDVRNDELALNLYQGMTETIEYVWEEAGVPKVLTGYTAILSIRDRPGGTLLANFATGGSGIVITPAAGKISVTMSAAETDVMNFGQGYYDLATESAGGVVTYHVRGPVNITRKTSIVP